jgi:hypothetical protein
MDPIGLDRVKLDPAEQLARLQSFLTLPRETIPRLTTRDAATLLRASAGRVGLEYVESSGVAPVFLLLPRGGASPGVTLFQTWHAETMATPAAAAVEGAERLALGAALAALEAVGASGALGPAEAPRAALVASPASSAGSSGLDQLLGEHRERLRAEAAFWIRIVPVAPRRRRVFLGSRGRVVVAVRGGEGNPYRARDQVVSELAEQAYGPRPLDFELLRKLAADPEAIAALGEAPGPETRVATGADGAAGAPAEERLRRALFDPRGDVVAPPAAHPERPRAWITIEIAEGMEPEPIARRVEALSGGGRADLVERFPWDRWNIHAPAIQALIAVAKARSEGAEIWPLSPWPSPSGLFSRALGTGLAEWGVPLPPGTAFRLPKPEQLEAITLEIAELLLRALEAGSERK